MSVLGYWINRGNIQEDKECPICLSSFLYEEILVTLPCIHIFHERCLSPWMKSKKNCPCCRLNLLPFMREVKVGRALHENSTTTVLRDISERVQGEEADSWYYNGSQIILKRGRRYYR